jgi:SAM-dependent methyltransferase
MAGASRDGAKAGAASGRPGWARTLYRLTPWGLRRALDGQVEAIANLAARLDGAGDRFLAVERRSTRSKRRSASLQRGSGLRDDRLVGVDRRFDALEASLHEAHAALTEVSATATRVRDELVPAVVDRGNLLIDRLAGELDEVASLVERMLRAEPLPMPAGDSAEREIAAALAEVQPRLLEAFRGDEEEIRHRLDGLLPILRGAAPVLDLGCGRGELLLLLREAGVAASGVDSDPALVQAARRRGLEVADGDALAALRALPEGSLGAVTAIHLLEHLAADAVLRLLGEVRRVLRRAGSDRRVPEPAHRAGGRRRVLDRPDPPPPAAAGDPATACHRERSRARADRLPAPLPGRAAARRRGARPGRRSRAGGGGAVRADRPAHRTAR